MLAIGIELVGSNDKAGRSIVRVEAIHNIVIELAAGDAQAVGL